MKISKFVENFPENIEVLENLGGNFPCIDGNFTGIII
jgi:hypothetical protein